MGLEKRIVLGLILAGFALASAGEAQARGFCQTITEVMAQAASGFDGLVEDGEEGRGKFAATLFLEGASACSVTRAATSAAYLCSWDHPYRDEGAYLAFDALSAEVQGCLGDTAARHRDQSVNHPDFYALNRFETATTVVSLSVKDKAALQQTFLFFRVEPRTAD